MNSMFWRVLLTGISGAILVLGGCSDPQQQAIKALHGLDLKFTVEEFHAAAGRGTLAGVQLFVEAGMGVDAADENGMRAVIKASEQGRTEVVQWLLENGADANAKGPNARTPLLAAAQGGNTDLVRLLLKNGADPMQKDSDDWSPLTLAAYKGHTGTVEVLAPQSIDLLDDALLVAAFEGNPEVLDLLLNHGAYVNARSPNNQSALMIASMNGRFDAVKVLLLNGANRFALDDTESTAADLAWQSGHADIGGFLNQPPDPAGLSEVFATGEDAFFEDAIDPSMAAAAGMDLARMPPQEVVGFAAGAAGPAAGPASAGAVRRPARADGIAIREEDTTRESVSSRFRMQEYREENLPIVLKNVGEGTAEVRVLYRDQEPVTVREGDPIADTGLQVVKFERQYANSKHGKGQLVDVSQMVVEDQRTGAKHLLIKDIPAKSSETYAVMQLDETGRAFDVRSQDEFTAAGVGFEDTFRVVDVRPMQVVIENKNTMEIYTIPRAVGLTVNR